MCYNVCTLILFFCRPFSYKKAEDIYDFLIKKFSDKHNFIYYLFEDRELVEKTEEESINEDKRISKTQNVVFPSWRVLYDQGKYMLLRYVPRGQLYRMPLKSRESLYGYTGCSENWANKQYGHLKIMNGFLSLMILLRPLNFWTPSICRKTLFFWI